MEYIIIFKLFFILVFRSRARKNELVWGRSIFGSKHSKSFGCENSDCEQSRSLSYPIYWRVASRVQETFENPRKSYALVWGCPSCFEKYWFHIDKHFAKSIRNKRQRANLM